MAGRTHIDISQIELTAIVKGYRQFGNNWGSVLADVKNSANLPMAAAQLYKDGKMEKLKRRMSDQIKKVPRDSYVPANDEIATLIQEIKQNNTRYQQKGHPLEKKQPLKTVIPPAVDVRHQIVDVEYQDLPDLHADEADAHNDVIRFDNVAPENNIPAHDTVLGEVNVPAAAMYQQW
ncbi:unnamed protein product [Mytilus coruscus]|uniref:Uncharacterized protein n=1 Tax=Mytilus coruscus TaxID=42192 RepID=A0A6J8EPX2_MYTCO|nr:unnamed protein product [Mytilus coruscus]